MKTFILCGVGKSYLIAQLGAAMWRAAGLRATAIHATDMIHGDLGILLGPDTFLVLITHSGRTYEVYNVAEHVRQHLPKVHMMLITGARAQDESISGFTHSVRRYLANGEDTWDVCRLQLEALRLLERDESKIDVRMRAKLHPGGHLGYLLKREAEL